MDSIWVIAILVGAAAMRTLWNVFGERVLEPRIEQAKRDAEVKRHGPSVPTAEVRKAALRAWLDSKHQ